MSKKTQEQRNNEQDQRDAEAAHARARSAVHAPLTDREKEILGWS